VEMGMNVEETTKILKQRLGKIVHVQGIDSNISHQSQQASSRQGLVKMYQLIMRLPSKYRVQQIKYVKTEGGGVTEQRVWEGIAKEVASRLEGIRRTVHDMIRSFVYVEGFNMWIAVTNDAVKEAEEISKWIREELSKIEALKQLRPDLKIDELYMVKAIPIYLKLEDAKLVLKIAIADLEEQCKELEERIRQAEQEKNRRALKKHEQELKHVKNLLEAFKKYLQQVEQSQATTHYTTSVLTTEEEA
jgi:cell division protein ZapA (FtsZ GTPase activity inhibitor)